MKDMRRGLKNAEEAVQLLKSGKIALSLCGHVHRQHTELDSRGYGEITAGSLTKFGKAAEIVFDNGVFTFSKITF